MQQLKDKNGKNIWNDSPKKHVKPTANGHDGTHVYQATFPSRGVRLWKRDRFVLFKNETNCLAYLRTVERAQKRQTESGNT